MLKDENLQPPLSRWSWFYSNEEERQSGGGERLKFTPSAIFVDGFWNGRKLVRMQELGISKPFKCIPDTYIISLSIFKEIIKMKKSSKTVVI